MRHNEQNGRNEARIQPNRLKMDETIENDEENIVVTRNILKDGRGRRQEVKGRSQRRDKLGRNGDDGDDDERGWKMNVYSE